MPKPQFSYHPFTIFELSLFSLLIGRKIILTCLVSSDIWDPDFTTYFFLRRLHRTESIWKKSFPFPMEKVARLEENIQTCLLHVYLLLHKTCIKHLLVTQQEDEGDSICL